MQTLNQILNQAEAFDKELPKAPEPLTAPRGAEIASWIDLALLKADATATQVKKTCEDARQCHFASVCLNPVYIPLARGLLRDAGIGICALIAFPLGASLPEDKAYEARRSMDNGASEVEMVINLGALKSESYGLLLNDMLFVAKEAHDRQAKLKMIIEAALLTRHEKILVCLLAQAAEADFVKTSTGYGPGGATLEDVELMRRVVGSGTGVIAGGGVRTLPEALAMIAAGANRIGASQGVAIYNAALGAKQ